jgi:GH25 family lysozyme M1 (1,4-beta-N-acetylmuramidase)
MLQPVAFDCNHDNALDFGKIATWAWGGCFKANQGLGFTDGKFRTRRAAAEAAGFLAGGYSFATDDPVAANVARFHSIVEPGPQTMMALDFEDLVHNAMSGTHALEFLDRSNQKLGRATWLYGGNRIVEHINHQDPKWIDMARVTPLWLCQYKRGIKPATVEELDRHIQVPKPWTTWTLLQYAADGAGPQPHTMPGVERNADLNVFRGDRAAFALAWPGQALAPPAAV